MKPSEWLDKAKEKKGLRSDYALAKLIGVGANAIANLRKRENGMDNFTAFRIAEILEINTMIVILDMEINRARNKEREDFWIKKRNVYM